MVSPNERKACPMSLKFKAKDGYGLEKPHQHLITISADL